VEGIFQEGRQLLREILEVKSGDHVLRYRPLRALAVACAYHARRSGNAVSKQRLAFVSEQCLLWCPLRCEIPLFKYTTWYSFNSTTLVNSVIRYSSSSPRLSSLEFSLSSPSSSLDSSSSVELSSYSRYLAMYRTIYPSPPIARQTLLVFLVG
jgi:hypothetical protein